MLRARFWGIVLAFAGAATALAGQLQFTNTPLDTASLPRITESEVGQKSNDTEPVTLVVQFARPIRPGDVEGLQNAGATVHNYLPDYAYLVSAPAGVAVQLGSLPGVSWAGLLPDYVKISKQLADRLSATDASKAAASTVQYNVLSATAKGAKELEARGFRILDARQTQMGWFQTRVDASLAKATDIAGINSVFRVEAVPEYELHGERAIQTVAGNLNGSGSAPTGPGYTTWLNSKGLSGGNGIVVQVQDDGLDKGIATNAAGTAHPDILGRIAGIFNATSDPLGDSQDGHGQINAGLIMANASLGTTDGAGFKLGQGVAPQATVYATKVFKNGFGPFDIGTNTLTSLARNAQNAGATFSNNSWGSSVDGEYTADSAEYDALTRDADPNEAGNQPMVYFFSAGNDGPAAGTIGAPASGKNVIAVGAAENSDADGTDGCIVGPSSSNSNRDVVNFSSRGPTLDNRFGVTVVAVGTHVNGIASTSASYNGLGVCDKFFPAGQTNYARSSGTSHSCPIACGAGMIVRELFNEQLASQGFPANPSPALIRGILANTATSLQGGNDGDGGTIGHVPNAVQGWGSVNLGNLLALKNSLFVIDQETLFTATGQNHEILLIRKDPTKPIKFTLTWTDAPGVPGAVALVNNLDLEVVVNGTTFKGNVFSNGASVTGGTADNRNTIEAVYLNNPAQEALTVRVKATNIAGNGVPNVGGALDQDYALFVTNATTQSAAGQIVVSPDSVTCDDTLNVTVTDEDLQGANTVDVDITTSNGDAETLTLNETAINSGVFEGTIDTATGTPATNGVLQVVDSATITATYDDANDGTGPAQVQDTATTDCAAPQVSNVQVINIFSNQAVVTFDTDDDALTVLRYGTNCGALGQSVQGTQPAITHELALGNLSPNTQYFFKIDVTDTAGNSATVGNGGGCFTFSTPARPDYYTELFSNTNNDLDRQQLTFTPDGSVNFYSVCKLSAILFPTDPNAGTVQTIGEESSVQVNFTGGKTFSFYGTSYSSYFVNDNGNITFGSGSSDFAESFDVHFAKPRISALLDDLTVSQQRPVRLQQLADRAVVTWVNVPEFATANQNSVQVEMFFDTGVIRITHLDLAALDGLVGLSRGQGAPPDLVESNLSAYALCNQNFTISGTVTESGAGALPGVTINGLPGSPVTDANGFYTATVPAGFTGTATPQKSGYAFSPSQRSYNSVGASTPQQDYTASQGVLSVTPSNHDVGSGATEVEFAVSNTGAGSFNWGAIVQSNSPWVDIVSGDSGVNSGTVRVAVDANNTASQRVATIRVTAAGAFSSPKDVTITQAAGSSLAVTPTTRGVAFSAGSTTFNVSNIGGGTLNWDATVIGGGDWLSITSGDSGANSGVITAAFTKNSGAQRTGTIRVTSDGSAVSQQDVTVVQTAAPDLVVTPLSRELNSGSGTTTFDVSVNGATGIAWSAEVISGVWLGITSDDTGVDAGQIEISFGSNATSTARVATVRFTAPDAKNAPIDVTLTQSGFASIAVVAPNGGEVLQLKSKTKIKWSSQGVAGTVRIELFKNGTFKRTLFQGVANDGKQPWKVLDVNKGTGYQIRVVSESNPNLSDLSNSSFQIVK